MKDVGHDDTTNERRRGPMSEQRRQRVRMEISREAARLFWDQGVADTTGEQIAQGVGLSVSSIWRYFRNKESCAEPVLARGVEEFAAVLRRWPRELSLEDHLVTWGRERPRDPDQYAYDLAEIKMIALADTEPALRAAWLMACDQGERQLVAVIADRLRRPTDDIEVRTHAAATTAVLRVLTEDISVAVLTGSDPATFSSPLERAERTVHALRVATGGVVGDPISS